MEILEIELLSNDIEGTYSFLYQILGLQVILKNDLSVSFWQYKIDVPIFKKQKPVYHFALTYQNQLLEAFAWMIMERKF
jgi:hypothetical protein